MSEKSFSVSGIEYRSGSLFSRQVSQPGQRKVWERTSYLIFQSDDGKVTCFFSSVGGRMRCESSTFRTLITNSLMQNVVIRYVLEVF